MFSTDSISWSITKGIPASSRRGACSTATISAPGKALWRVPLGELEKLTQQGVPKTGSQTLGGASVTAGGLVFVAGTEDEKLRAFDADTGAELWSAKLPFAGTAAPAIYEVNGRQFVVITAMGGGRVGGASGPGDAYVAFALKR